MRQLSHINVIIIQSHDLIRVEIFFKNSLVIFKSILVLVHMVNLYKTCVGGWGWEGVGVWHYIIN